MTTRHAEIDEETPFLRTDPHGHHKRRHSPFPWAQFSVLLVLRLAQTLADSVIYPFTPELIRNIGITHGDESRVGYYVGLLQSIFHATQVVTVLFWSRVSDHLGRKPVIMTGLLGLSLSMYCFGLSRTFWGLVVSESLHGALNSNVGVMTSTLAEITGPSNIPRAYVYLYIACAACATVGSIIGGSLSRPTERFPSVFGKSEFLKTHPYFLACSIPATFSAVACLIAFFFLKETVAKPLSLRKLLSQFPKGAAVERDVSQVPNPVVVDDNSRPLPIRLLLIRRVIVAAGNQACLAIVNTSLHVVQPVFYSTPIVLGGLGLEPPTIGLIASLCAIVSAVLQIVYFPKFLGRFGTKLTYLAGLASILPVFALFPFINELARQQGLSLAVWVLVIGQALMSMTIYFSFGCAIVFVTASSPNKASLGTVNGMAHTLVSIVRMVCPVTANSLFSLSIDQEHHYMGGYLVYYVLVAITCVAIYVGTLLPEKMMSDEAVPAE